MFTLRRTIDTVTQCAMDQKVLTFSLFFVAKENNGAKDFDIFFLLLKKTMGKAVLRFSFCC